MASNTDLSFLGINYFQITVRLLSINVYKETRLNGIQQKAINGIKQDSDVNIKVR